MVRGRGVLELGDLRLLEDGGELRSALGYDAVSTEPVNERWSGDGERSGVSRGADTKANAWWSVRCHVEAHFRLLICVVLRREAIAEAAAAPSLLVDRSSDLSCVK